MSKPFIGIRAKIAAMLTVVAFLPLLIVLVVTVMQWSNIRKDIAGNALLSLAAAEARGLSVSMVKDIQTFQMDLHSDFVHAQLAQANKNTPLPMRDLSELDRQWPTMPLDSPSMYAVLHHPLVGFLKQVEVTDGRIVQSFITDKYGQLVAATGRTEDFYQADEQWWTDTVNDGAGRIVILPIDYDTSLKLYVLKICMPIFDIQDKSVIGVVKFKIDLTRWLGSVSPSPGHDARAMLVRDDGLIVCQQGQAQGARSVSAPVLELIKKRHAGWIAAEDQVQAFVPLATQTRIGGIAARMPDLWLAMSEPARQVMMPVYYTAVLSFAAGLGVIILIFLACVIVVDRLVVRRIRSLEKAARRVAGGDLTARVSAGAGRLGMPDEIDDLDKNFNEMAGHIERTHNELTAINELKSNFIKIASHELRTPVSYILGIIKLLRDNRDPERLSQAISSIAARAKRLDDIIHAMFKLLPDKLSEQVLRDEDVYLQELMEEIYVNSFPFIEQRGQKLQIDCASNLPVIRADRQKLFDVVENLVINAIKFTPNGGQVTVVVRSELGNMVSIAVTDQGTGIPQKELPYLFQPFYSGGEVLQHSTGDVGFQKRGMGLGLAIVRHFVELHGGTVNLHTGPKGSTFIVLLPIHRSPTDATGHDFAI